MKIICIGRNYSDHAKELNNEVPDEPVIFLKPETAVLLKKQPFFIPDFSQDVHHEVEIVVKINRLGKHIEEKFAHKYYDEIGLGIDFTARDLQAKLKAKGLPWERAKGFDGSAAVGTFVSKNELGDWDNVEFKLLKNKQIVQHGFARDMIFSVDKIIAFVSQYFTLKIGDLIFTGTPAGVGKVEKEDALEGFLNDKKILEVNVK
jgi:2-keto-4-pentenoate hydratase/2-oxohepta-3-ene-1,7-dioic acid hydratase in catechol pathway